MGDYPKLTLLNSIKCSVEILASFKTIQRICIIYCEIKFFQDHLDMWLIVHGKHPSIWLLSRPLLDNSLCIGQCVLHELTPFKTISICQNALSIRISFFQDHTSNAHWLLSRPLHWFIQAFHSPWETALNLTPFKTLTGKLSMYRPMCITWIDSFQDHLSLS